MKERSLSRKGKVACSALWAAPLHRVRPAVDIGAVERVHESVDQQAQLAPSAYAIDAIKVGPASVQICLEVVAELELARGGQSRLERMSLLTSRYFSH